MRRLLPVAVSAVWLCGCGRSALVMPEEDDDDETEESESESETGATETETGTETGDEATFLDTGDPPDLPEPLSCREMLECLLECISGGGDLMCLQSCGEGLDPEEAAAAGALLFCVVGGCVENESCTIDDLASEDCVLCLGVGLIAPEPTGCEAEAAACE